MAKTARLTRGLSLCKIKTPSMFLDTAIGRHYATTPSVVAISSILKSCLVRESLSRTRRRPRMKQPFSKSTSDPPQLASLYTRVKARIYQEGFSDPGMRFLVYVVSLALSLAALSIPKLHELLEWLTLDVDAPLPTSPPSTDVGSLHEHDLITKSTLISEILRTAASRYLHGEHIHRPCADFPATFMNSAPSFPMRHYRMKPALVTCSHAEVAEWTENRHTTTSCTCFHSSTTLHCGTCLLCLLYGSHTKVSRLPLAMGKKRRCYSDSEKPRVLLAWPKMSRPNAGICRGQVGLSTTQSVVCLTVEMCAPLSPSSRINERGLHIASEVKCGSGSVWRLSGIATASPHRPLASPKLVACVAPTSSTEVPPRTPTSTTSYDRPPTQPVTSCKPSLPCLNPAAESTDVDVGAIPPLRLHVAAVTTLPRLNYFHRANTCTAFVPTCKRDCSVDTRSLNQEGEEEEEEDVEGENSDADGLELDDEGVYFVYDYRVTGRKTKALSDESESADEAGHGYNYDDDFVHDLTATSATKAIAASSSHNHVGGLSDLVALTTSISDDLVQLESGCQELISRVHANRIELDYVRDSLGFVWESKDVSDDDEEERTGERVVGAPYTEVSWLAGSGCSLATSRHTPMGASFISTSSAGAEYSCCSCNCHHHQQLQPQRIESEKSGSNFRSSLTLVEAESPRNDHFFYPSASFEDDDEEEEVEESPLHCASQQGTRPNIVGVLCPAFRRIVTSMVEPTPPPRPATTLAKSTWSSPPPLTTSVSETP